MAVEKRMMELIYLNENIRTKTKPLIKEGISDYLHYGADVVSSILDYTGAGAIPAAIFDIAHAFTYFVEAKNETDQDKREDLVFGGWITLAFSFLPFVQPFAIGIKKGLKNGLKNAKLNDIQLDILAKVRNHIDDIINKSIYKINTILDTPLGKKILGKNVDVVNNMIKTSKGDFKKSLDYLQSKRHTIKNNAINAKRSFDYINHEDEG